MSQILVVDDEEPIREVLIEFLGDHGFTAEGAPDGATAVTLAGSRPFQVILLDIAMPGMNGIETLKRLRQTSPHSAVIMISGHADSAMALQALDLGAYDFIQKPLDFHYLERTLIARIVTLDPAGQTSQPAEPEKRSARGSRTRR